MGSCNSAVCQDRHRASSRKMAEKDAEIERLRARLADAETSLRIFDQGGSSEYWVRWPDDARGNEQKVSDSDPLYDTRNPNVLRQQRGW